MYRVCIELYKHEWKFLDMAPCSSEDDLSTRKKIRVKLLINKCINNCCQNLGKRWKKERVKSGQ